MNRTARISPTRGQAPYFGTCLVNGNHAEGSDLAKECPVLRKAQKALNLDPQGVDTGSPEMTQSALGKSATSTTVFRRGRAFKPGRPPVPSTAQRQKARDRDRAYRQRRKATAVSA